MRERFDTADPLVATILGRPRSMFADDVAAHHDAIAESIAGKRLLVVGAGGSIGASFVLQLARYRPRALHLVDLNENTLVEVVRDLRSSDIRLCDDFLTVSIDFGALEFARFVAAHGPYDQLLNFSALKHVRAERDPFSLMRMIDVNVRALDQALETMPGLGRAFSVSTDKSVRPANLMGATKNLMEQVLFCRPGLAATTARFANVAFSAGSLLESFEMRLAKGQALAAPGDVRRYLISHEEAGQLCLMAAFLGGEREAFFPRLDENALMSFVDIARAFLASKGLEMRVCADEQEAKDLAANPPAGTWPCHVSASDTSGEKPFEEFFRVDDRPDFSRFQAVGVMREAPADPARVKGFLADIAAMRARPSWDKAEIAALIRRAVPDLDHVVHGRSLDEKM